MSSLHLTSEDHEKDLSSAVASWLVRNATGAPDETTPDESAVLWRKAEAELGLAGLLVPEKLGGQGAGPREAAVVAGLLGTHLAPVPFIHRAAIANTLVAAVSQDTALVEAAATGERLLAVAVPQTRFFADDQFTGAELDGSGRVSGTVHGVVAVLDATDVVVPARSADGPVLVLVPTSDPAVQVSRELTLDETRPVATVTITGAVGTVLAAGEEAARALHDALLLGVALLSAEQTGLALASLDATVAYSKERRQFGRPIGSFQSLKHRMAELWLASTSAEAASLAAADSLAQDHPDAERIVCTAAAYAGDAAVKVTEERLQLRGGIGMTWEDPTHLYVKRAKSDQVTLGTTGHLLQHLAPLAGLTP